MSVHSHIDAPGSDLHADGCPFVEPIQTEFDGKNRVPPDLSGVRERNGVDCTCGESPRWAHDHDEDGPHEHEDHASRSGWGGYDVEGLTVEPVVTPWERTLIQVGFEKVDR